MNANVPDIANRTTYYVCCRETPLNAALIPGGTEYVEYFCGLDYYERFRAHTKAAIESNVVPVPGGSQPSD